MSKKIGAHLSIAGGYKNAFIKASEIGANCLQIFSTSPRAWGRAIITQDIIDQFKKLKEKYAIDPVYFHASYLINLANSGAGGELSKKALIHELNAAYALGVRGSVVHPGSFKSAVDDIHTASYQILIDNIKDVLSKTPDETLLVIENAGNRKIGRSIEQIARIVKDVDNPRIRVCLDTCHAHAAGYDMRTEEKLNEFLYLFDQSIGIENLELFHVNDSRDAFGSLRDRHENIGIGQVGIQTFQLLTNHPKLHKIPFIIETPGFDKKGPDKKNVDILRSLIS